MERDDSLLDQAVAVWTASRIASRDARLAVGGLVAGFIEANLAHTPGMNWRDRKAGGLSRSALIVVAARRLRVCPSGLRELLCVRAVVDLLSDGGHVGNLSYSALRAMWSLVERPSGAVSLTRQGGGLSAAEKASWRIKGDALEAKAFFRKAVAEDWACDEVKSALHRRARGEAPKKEPTHDLPPGTDLFALARMGTAKDVADLVLQLIRASPEAGVVWGLVEHGFSPNHGRATDEAARRGTLGAGG